MSELLNQLNDEEDDPRVTLTDAGLLLNGGELPAGVLDWGGPELAVPGSGDVLSGCIGALLAAGLNPLDAARLGGALHGMAGERLARDGVDGVLASEIAEALRTVLHELRREAV